MIAEREEIEFQALALYHPFAWNIGDFDFREIRLTRNRTKRGKFRTIKLYPIIVVLMFILKGLQHFWRLVRLVLRLLPKSL